LRVQEAIPVKSDRKNFACMWAVAVRFIFLSAACDPTAGRDKHAPKRAIMRGHRGIAEPAAVAAWLPNAADPRRGGTLRVAYGDRIPPWISIPPPAMS